MAPAAEEMEERPFNPNRDLTLATPPYRELTLATSPVLGPALMRHVKSNDAQKKRAINSESANESVLWHSASSSSLSPDDRAHGILGQADASDTPSCPVSMMGLINGAAGLPLHPRPQSSPQSRSAGDISQEELDYSVGVPRPHTNVGASDVEENLDSIGVSDIHTGDHGANRIKCSTKAVERPQDPAYEPWAKRVGAGGRNVVYVDHHHVHHHHHFHGTNDWGSGDDIPPETVCKWLDRKAEIDVEHIHTVKLDSEVVARHKPSTHSSIRRRKRAQHCEGGDAFLPEIDFSAELLVCRDIGTSMTFNGVTSATCVAGNGNTSQQEKLPMQEYFALVSQLPMKTRLQFSPYSVPRSARNDLTDARGGSSKGGRARTARGLRR